jgi:predicted unusual protein kinase regulating ubiquinone biosynthesis (AarF/ABC1/UbiB family)
MANGEALRRVEALIAVSLRLARSAASGRILLARLADTIDPAWIPQPLAAELIPELEAAQADAREPLAWKTVERALRGAWGGPPADELDELEPEPVAVTPSAQVHRGALDGEPVAVKILRPGLADSVRRDLALLEGLLAPLNGAFPSLDAGAVLREFRERVLDELDLEHEAGTQRRFHRALRGHPFLTVPAPVMRLCHEGVLVSPWIDGPSLWEAPDPDRAAAQLVVFVIGAARFGQVHANPHPDDVRVLADGSLAILDFGSSRAISTERVDSAAAALEAFVAADSVALGQALEKLGWLGAEHSARALELGQEALSDLAGPDPVRLDVAAVVAARDRLLGRPDALTELLLAGSLPPEDLWPARGAAELFGTIARVGATGPWRELVRAALRDGWAAPAG